MRTVVTYVVTFLLFGVLDVAWISVVAMPMYRSTLGGALLDQFRIVPAVLFYVLQIAGILVFVLPAAAGSWTMALLFGALFGLFTYATYDLTNYATIRDWTLSLTAADMAWGMVVTGVASALSVALVPLVLRSFGLAGS